MQDPTFEERAVHGAARVALVALAAVVGLSTFYAAPKLADRIVGTQSGPATAANADPKAVNNPANGNNPANRSNTVNSNGNTNLHGTNPNVVPPGLSCTGSNGGKTDVGIDSKDIYLAGTEVESGIGQSFLGPVHYGIQAVLQKTNRQGGVCQRQLHLVLKDDGWDPRLGKQFLGNFIQSNQYFALAVVPSSNGLDGASQGGDIDKADDPVTGTQGIPVVGNYGMLNSQYSDPWIWPVAASTATSMRIMAHDAVQQAHKLFPAGHKVEMGIVYDQNYPFGPEGAGGFVNQAQRDGAEVRSDCRVALTAGQNGYGTQAKEFNDACGDGAPHQVDFVALLL